MSDSKGIAMRQITINGAFDHMFKRDRIEDEAGVATPVSVPPYNRNSLGKPMRALSAKEAAILNKVGMPRKPTAK